MCNFTLNWYQDLNEIADYFAVNNVRAGEKFFNDFNRKCKQLVAFPNSGKSYSGYQLSGIQT
jgi:toxin ParE1/3/4